MAAAAIANANSNRVAHHPGVRLNGMSWIRGAPIRSRSGRLL